MLLAHGLTKVLVFTLRAPPAFSNPSAFRAFWLIR
jgi:hypothetical protein